MSFHYARPRPSVKRAQSRAVEPRQQYYVQVMSRALAESSADDRPVVLA
jgi:hypothetical protein